MNSLLNLYASIKRLSSGLRETLGFNKDNLRAYIKGLCNYSSIVYTIYNQDRYTINNVYDITGCLYRAFNSAAV